MRDREIESLFAAVVKWLTQLFAKQSCRGSSPLRSSKKATISGTKQSCTGSSPVRASALRFAQVLSFNQKIELQLFACLRFLKMFHILRLKHFKNMEKEISTGEKVGKIARNGGIIAGIIGFAVMPELIIPGFLLAAGGEIFRANSKSSD